VGEFTLDRTTSVTGKLFLLRAEYCDERICLSVCLSVRDHIFGITRPIFTRCFVHFTCGLWPWLGPPLVA